MVLLLAGQSAAAEDLSLFHRQTLLERFDSNHNERLDPRERRALRRAFGGIDICINNAGINIIKPYAEYSADAYQRLMNINLKAPFSITQQLIPGMKKRGFGRIVNIASIWSEISKPGRALYTTSKTGLVGFTRSLAVEHAPSNILVNVVSPGFTRTELTEESLSADEIKTLSEQIPVQRFAEPNEIAQTVLFLCSDLNTYITGQNIVVDGGFTLV